MKKKTITWVITDNGCHVCTSHAPNSDGYPTMRHEGKTIKIYRHMYQQKYGKLSSNICLLHSCDNRLCISIEHLSEGTRLDNIKDMVNKNRHVSGTRVASAKLDRNIVEYIRSSDMSTSELAKIYKVSASTIRRARNGVYWK